jgi:hypothetical protein
MQELAIPAEARSPGPRARDKVPKVRISPLVREACELLGSGQCKTITEAAKVLNCSREHLSISLSKPHVITYRKQRAEAKISGALERSVEVKLALLDAASEKVRSEVASEIMGIGGISAPKGGGITINNNIDNRAGYVIKLRAEDDSAPIDITPGRGVAGGVSE